RTAGVPVAVHPRPGALAGRLLSTVMLRLYGPFGRLQLLNCQVDKRPHLWRQVLAVRIGRIDGHLDRRTSSEDLDELSGLEIVGYEKVRYVNQSLAESRRQAQGIGAVYLQVPGWPEHLGSLRRIEAPFAI